MTFRPAAFILHGAAAGVMYWGYNGLDGTPMDDWVQTQKGGHFQFLTIQGLAVAGVTMVVSLVADLFPSVTVFKTIKRTLFMIAMPLAVVISSIYWSLVLLAPQLILMENPLSTEPSSAAPVMMRIPLEVDLALHAAPGIALFLDFFLFEKRYSKKQALYGAPTISILSTLWYSSWVEYFAKFNGRFPYPFLNDVVEVRYSIYAGATMLALVSFWLLNAAHR